MSVQLLSLCEILLAFGFSKQTAQHIAQETFSQTTLLNSFPCLLLPHLAQGTANAVVHHTLFLLVHITQT